MNTLVGLMMFRPDFSPPSHRAPSAAEPRWVLCGETFGFAAPR
jgi:hypothetical protein